MFANARDRNFSEVGGIRHAFDFLDKKKLLKTQIDLTNFFGTDSVFISRHSIQELIIILQRCWTEHCFFSLLLQKISFVMHELL